MTTVIVPAERGSRTAAARWCPTSAPSTPSPSRCFPSYALRRRAQGASARSRSSSFCSIAAAARRGLGGLGARPRGPARHVGCALRTRLPRPGRRARRAELRTRSGLSPSAPVGLWGYSGGGLATAWAAEMSGDYAPELNIVGAVLGSPVGDLGHTFRRLNGSILSGLPAMVVAALAHIYPDLDRVIQEHATDEGKAMLARLERMTTVARRAADGR